MKLKKIRSSKKINDREREQRHFGVILEDINGKFQYLVEGQELLDKRTNDIDKRTSDIDKRLVGFQSEMRDFQSETRDFQSETRDFQSETRANFKSVFEYLSRIDEELKDIRTELTEIKNHLEKKADLERVEKLERRVANLEIQLASYKKDFHQP